jgi:hypothetical protein
MHSNLCVGGPRALSLPAKEAVVVLQKVRLRSFSLQNAANHALFSARTVATRALFQADLTQKSHATCYPLELIESV